MLRGTNRSKQILKRTHTSTQWQTKLVRDNGDFSNPEWESSSKKLNRTFSLLGRCGECFDLNCFSGLISFELVNLSFDSLMVEATKQLLKLHRDLEWFEIVGSRFYSLKKFFWFPRWLSKSATTQESKIIFKSPGPPCPSFLMCSKLLPFNYVQLHLSPRGWSSIACSSAISSCRKGCHWTWTLHVLHLHSVAWQWSVNGCETLPFPLVALYICLLQQMPSWKTLEIVLYSSVVLISHKPS